jgi:hypothetical protein
VRGDGTLVPPGSSVTEGDHLGQAPVVHRTPRWRARQADERGDMPREDPDLTRLEPATPQRQARQARWP